MTPARASDWAGSPHHTAAVADATQAAITTARREIELLEEALEGPKDDPRVGNLKRSYLAAVEGGDYARAHKMRQAILRTLRLIRERRRILEAKP